MLSSGADALIESRKRNPPAPRYALTNHLPRRQRSRVPASLFQRRPSAVRVLRPPS
ncbi:MAG: hypothetical protein ACK559_07155 [bacterium]